MISWIVPQGSTYAAQIDNVINLVAVIVGFWFFLTLGAFFFLLWKYRAKPGVRTQYVDGSNPKHKRFISVPHNIILLCDVVLIVFAVRAWVYVKQTLPEPTDAEHATHGHVKDEKIDKVRIVAQQWAWSFQYPGADGKFDTGDDVKVVDELHVMKNHITEWELVSRDVLHSLSIPVFRLKQDAIPGRVVSGWFEATQKGSFDLQCTEICGLAHGIMFAKVIVETPAERELWMTAHAPAGAPAAAPAPATPAPATPAPATPAPATPPAPTPEAPKAEKAP